MSINAKVEKALSGIVPNIWLFICPDERPPDEYVTYNPAIDVPVEFGDNKDLVWTNYLQVHFFTKKNYIKKRSQIREALKKNGFLIDDLEIMYEKDSKFYHIVFSCNIEENMEE